MQSCVRNVIAFSFFFRNGALYVTKKKGSAAINETMLFSSGPLRIPTDNERVDKRAGSLKRTSVKGKEIYQILLQAPRPAIKVRPSLKVSTLDAGLLSPRPYLKQNL